MKTLGIALALLLISSSSFGQDKKLRAYLDNKQFYAPGVGNYMEFNLQFVGYSMNYNGVEGGLIADLLVESMIVQGTDTVNSDAYRLSSPLMRDSIVEDFFDVQRFQLDPGEYEYSIRLTDLNSKSKPLTATTMIDVRDLSDAISISDIEVAEVATIGDTTSVFYKSGYNIIPRLSTFYPKQISTLPIYFEIYNSTQLEDNSFRLKQSIIDANTGIELTDDIVYTDHAVAEVVPVFRKIHLEKLLTGTYMLKFTIVNINDIELSSQTYEFERSNDRTIDLSLAGAILDPAFQESITDDSLLYYLECIIPIAGASEVRSIMEIAKSRDKDRARKYIQTFWTTIAPQNPYEQWIKYKLQVQWVETVYANNFQEGYETDRGRVYLQYGQPDNIAAREVSTSEYPYEIWRYNKIGVFSNKRFVFYNPDLVNNAYRLLHSDMIGELKNQGWPQELSKRNTRNGGVDNPNSNVIDKWGENALDDFGQ